LHLVTVKEKKQSYQSVLEG